MPLPANVDHAGILSDLARWGWRDFKIETACGFSRGYIAQLKCGNVQQMSYQRAARLHNLWEDEAWRQGMVSGGTLPIQTFAATLAYA